jgi:rhodanese-related sulfurtransferase
MLPGAIAYTWLGYAGREALGGGDGMIRNILIALALLATVAFLPRFVRKLRENPMLAVDTLKQQLDTGADVLLLDVRPAADFTGEQGHIASARNVPLEDLPARLADLEEYKTRPVRLVCRTDRRSAQAARLLLDAGFSDALIIEGGMTAWRARGWPVIEAKNDYVVTRAAPRIG